ncbi:uncharacterized protein LOC141855653 [Brevipalpus obovatus]|uniref:uncharacterized protein LOC141855653 n=1 Tax=Brevipalpus obovatus TaxID=246614 RepID=UPI003D9FAB41
MKSITFSSLLLLYIFLKDSQQESTPSPDDGMCPKTSDSFEIKKAKLTVTLVVEADRCLVKEFIPHQKEAQKCGKLELVGGRGKEHEKENCQKNSINAVKYMDCQFEWSDLWHKNENFTKCFKKNIGKHKKEIMEMIKEIRAKLANKTSPMDRAPMPMFLKLKDSLHSMESKE